MKERRVTLNYLSESDLDQIEETAFRLLEEVGIVLDHELAREMLHGLGCRVDNRTTIPRDVIGWALDQVVPDREGRNRDGSLAFTMGDGKVRFHNGGGQPIALDLDSGKKRPATLQDVIDVTRLLDALPNVDHITPLFGPQDVAPELMMIESTAAQLRNSAKPMSSAAIDKPEDVPYVVEMAAACCGGVDSFRQHPNLTISVSPISPLKFTHDLTDAIIATVQSGAPFHSLPAPSLGATGPITMAGCLAQQHAEILASFVIAAATQPGARVGYCSRISPIDLRTAISVWGGPEVGISGACAGQLAHRLGFPCDSYGLSTTSNLLDPQFAYERLSNAMIPALAGVDMLSGVGNGGGLVAGLEIAVIDDELIGLIKHIVAGCPVNDVTLAYDVMQDVILRDGVYLGEMHTVKQMRQGALWLPEISTRGSVSESAGVVERAQERARHILGTHQVETLSAETERHLDAVLERARRELSR